MNISTDIMVWVFGASIGIAMNIFMVIQSFHDRRETLARGERLVTWGHTVQWGFGLSVKLILLLIGLWAMCLPKPGERPETALQLWAVAHAHIIFVGGLMLSVYDMDARDGILIYLWRKGRGWLREEVKEATSDAMAAAVIQHEAALIQHEAADIQKEAAEQISAIHTEPEES